MPELTGQGIVAGGSTSYSFTSAPSMTHSRGERMRDRLGNEYVFCEFVTTNVSGGLLVGIDSGSRAAPLLGTETGARRVGVAMTGQTAGTNWGWVQVYGVHLAVQTTAVSDLTSANEYQQYVCIPQTSVGTPSGLFSLEVMTTGSTHTSTNANEIVGMWVMADSDVTNHPDFNSDLDVYGTTLSSDTTGATTGTTATTAGTSMHFGLSLPCFLNYPYVRNQPRSVGITGAVSDVS